MIQEGSCLPAQVQQLPLKLFDAKSSRILPQVSPLELPLFGTIFLRCNRSQVCLNLELVGSVSICQCISEYSGVSIRLCLDSESECSIFRLEAPQELHILVYVVE